jgi:NAD+ kinase
MRNRLTLKKSKKIAIFYRHNTAKALELSEGISLWLKEHKYSVFTAPEQKKIPGTQMVKSVSALKDMSLILVLGGDGTYLRAVRMLEGCPIPILGINVGSLGFLTTTRVSELYDSLEKTFNGDMDLCPRAMFEVEVLRKKKVICKGLSLNDIVIERGSLSQLIHLAIYNKTFLVSELKADGLIISTPTGSTAYNLAAGGPILHPDVEAFVVTPIAPHALTSRPFIFPDNLSLSFRLLAKKQKAHFVVDGEKYLTLTSDDEVIIRRSKNQHLMLREKTFDFYGLLREKLKFGDR